MYEFLSDPNKFMVENIYQMVLVEFGRASKHIKIAIVYSHHRQRFMPIRSNDARWDKISEDPNYELVETYSGVPLPRIDQVAGDVMAYLDEQAKRATGHQPAV